MIKHIRSLKSWQLDAIAVAAGVLTPFAFAPFSIWPLAFVAMMLLTATWIHATPSRAFWRGWLFGVAMFGIGVSWVYVSMNRFGGMSPMLAGFVTLLFVLFLALFPALVGFLSKKIFKGFENRIGIYLFVLVPMLWILVEWVRSWIFTGFPWLSLGYSQIDTPLGAYAPVFGIYGIGYAVIVTSTVVLYGLLKGKPGWKHALPVIAVVWVVGFGLKWVDWSEPAGDAFKVTMIQGNISQDLKWENEQRLPTLKLYTELSKENWSSRLVIWPETAIPGFYHQFKPFLNQISQEARMNSSELLVGIPIYDEKRKLYFNAMMSLGNNTGFYEKRHLVPFGEYLPLKNELEGLLDFFKIPMSDFSSGDENTKPILEVAGYIAGISICYEDVFGNEVANALPEANFLVNASNDAWFGDSIAPHQHTEIARMRALETGRYLLRATNTGVTSIIDDKGKIRATAPQFQVAVLTGEVTPMTGMSIYAVFGNIPVITAMIIMLIITTYIHWQSGKKK